MDGTEDAPYQKAQSKKIVEDNPMTGSLARCEQEVDPAMNEKKAFARHHLPARLAKFLPEEKLDPAVDARPGRCLGGCHLRQQRVPPGDPDMAW